MEKEVVYTENIGENIRLARKARGLTQKQLGDMCGMADSAIRRYELGNGRPKMETIQRIAKALNVDPFSLMDWDMASDAIFDRMNNRAKYLLAAFDQLNDEGQCKALERVEELTEIPKYKK